MYQGKHCAARPTGRPKRRVNRKAGALFVSLLLVLVLAVGGTVAYLSMSTEPVTNTFTPSTVSCSVTESFDGTNKKNVNVTNTGDTDAYIRVKLVTYRVNENGEHIGGTAEIPSFTLGSGWVQSGEYYYYTKPVAPNGKPAAELISSILLTGSYDDADGGKQVIEVMAEAIQSAPAEAVQSSWGVTVGSDGSLSVA